ncbi:MAG: regulatory iron-sulfur-containing complex subunit RicT [Saprospiraceae bacterium]|nr:regulatory iron-sulfur-containing complex subunit RicT [Saprospiraceae bacterium]
MACSTCQSGSPNGCQDNGHCATGGCNKMNTYDWLAVYDYEDPTGTDIVEISFKKGARKEFFRNHQFNPVQTRDMVVVDTGTGFDVGIVSLSGELVRLQMKKKRVKEITVTNPVVRIANDRDVERLNEYRALEKQAMVRGRAITVSLGLDMKISDVEYRGDGRKATFYYTAEGRVDFRELVRLYAKEFQIKVEMRQIGARQESSRIGGIGTCGRELCCSTWLTDFKSVNTHAARYQNLSINQAKLSGQCGRLKCCLNYELDTYMEAIDEFPQDVDVLRHQGGSASLIKMDIFKRLLYYSVEVERGRNTVMALSLERVKLIKQMNLKGELPDQLQDPNLVVEEEQLDFADVGGDIELPDYKKKKNKKKKPGQRPDGQNAGGQQQPQQRREQSDRSNQPKRDNQQRRNDQSPRPPRDPNAPRGEQKPREPRDPNAPKQEHKQRPPRDPNEPRGEQKPREPRPPRDPNAPRGDQQPREPRPPRDPNAPRSDQQPREPRDPNAPRNDENRNQQGGGQNRNRNRNKNRNRGPRPEGGERPPPNNPTE